VAAAVQGKQQDNGPSGNRQPLVWLICIVKPQMRCSCFGPYSYPSKSSSTSYDSGCGTGAWWKFRV